jgi:hypothetical protein
MGTMYPNLTVLLQLQKRPGQRPIIHGLKPKFDCFLRPLTLRLKFISPLQPVSLPRVVNENAGHAEFHGHNASGKPESQDRLASQYRSG